MSPVMRSIISSGSYSNDHDDDVDVNKREDDDDDGCSTTPP